MAITMVDTARAEAFAGRALQVANNGMLALLLSIGHQTGLFDRLAGLPPSTSAQIAAAAGLQERYVREWLAGMVVGRIVEYDPLAQTYTLPPEHALSLTRAAGPNNLAFLAASIPLFGVVEQQVIAAFQHGGGVGYSAYADLQRWQDELGRVIYDATLVTTTLPSVPGLVERLRAGISVLEIGCGSGHALNLIAQAFPNSRFVGYDFTEQRIARAQAEMAELGLANVSFSALDLDTFDQRSCYDLVLAFDVIHDLAHPQQVLNAVAAALRPGGVFLMAEVAASSALEENLDHPLGPALYTVSLMHCMTVSLAQNGAGLGTMWGAQQARRMLAEAGFTSVDVLQIPGDFQNSYYVCRKSE